QPREAMRKQIATGQESQCPAADVRESEQDEQAGDNTESAGQQHHPPILAPIGETQDAPDDPGGQQQRTKQIGQDQSTSLRLIEEHEPKSQIERAQKDLPEKSAPSFGPEGVRDLERANGQDYQPDHLHAD